MSDSLENKPKGPWWKEITQPFVDLARAPRALWGVNLSYFIEGLVYFGMLGYLAMFFNTSVGLSDEAAGISVGFLTFGITFSMFLFGGLGDKLGVRTAILIALTLMFIGRATISVGPTLGLGPDGLGSPIHLLSMAGILLIVLGYGIYQPSAYAAVRKFTTPATASMGFAMLYALMNLGGWLPSFAFLLRDEKYLGLGIPGVYWIYTALTLVGILVTFFILTPKVEKEAIAQAALAHQQKEVEESAAEPVKLPASAPFWAKVWHWIKNHPLANPKFSFFIFSLIPVQTLFAHNWLTLPMYVNRAYQGTWLGQNFELATNFNPLLIFILVPIVTALTWRRNIYTMMILGTAIMALPTFLLTTGPSPAALFGFLVLMTIGEAMWQPRFLQYAAEIAPKGRTAAYMGIAQFPWFLTKVITPLFSGYFLSKYCPADTPAAELNTETMWLIYGVIASTSSVLLILARGWLGKDFKAKKAV